MVIQFFKKILNIKSPSKDMFPGTFGFVEMYSSEMIEEILISMAKHTPFSFQEIKEAFVISRSLDLTLFSVVYASMRGVGLPLRDIVELTAVKQEFRDYMLHRFSWNHES